MADPGSTGVAPSFERWVESVFQHPVKEPSWWWEEGAVRPFDPASAPAEALELLTKLLERSSVLAAFTDEQVAQGLWLLFDTSCSEYTTLLRRQDLPWEARERCVKALPLLYRELFAVRCAPVLGHPSAAPLNGTCYMLWDLSEALEPRPDDKRLDELCLGTLDQVLGIRHVACQDSALHALGHWAIAYPEHVASMIDRFLQSQPEMPQRLREYAANARAGRIE